MMRPPDDLRGAVHEEADDTAYPDVEALVTGARRRVVVSRRRRLAAFSAAIAAALVVGVLVTTQSTPLAVQQPAGRGATTPAPSATPTPSISKPASQFARDARVYGIDPAIAALPIGVRVWPPPPDIWPVATTQSSTPEGLWLVSHPGAFEGADLATHPQLTDYGELLLVTPDRRRILRAYPFLAVPPQWLLVTPQAVYCGRQGDGGLPDSMVCRVERSTSALTVVVFPSPTDSAFGEPQALAGRPGNWRLAGSLTSAFLQQVPRLTANGLLFAPDPNAPGGGKSLLLDPVSLRS